MASNDQSNSQQQIEGSRRESSAKPHHQNNHQNNHQNHSHPHPQSNPHGKPNHYQNPNSRPVRKKGGHFNEKPIFTCLVCCQDYPSFKHKAIFAIGPCNHMVCYYCSTKMRVLCEQSECPTCRQELSEVVFWVDLK